MSGPDLILPDWPAPAGVRAAFTLRSSGVSRPPFDSFNIGAHVGDEPLAVEENRRLLRAQLELPAEPAWLTQVHGARVADLDAEDSAARPADGAVTRTAVGSARSRWPTACPCCLQPRTASAVGAAHAGWRGLAGGVLEAVVDAMRAPPEGLLAWLGPAIGQAHFEVGEEVRAAFLAADPGAAAAFTANPRGRWQCDLYGLARRRLAALGVTQDSRGGLVHVC